jgi:integrase
MAKAEEKCLVRVEEFKGRLRLRWTERGGKRRVMALGCYAGRTAEVVARGLAATIEADIITGNYDSSLVKYRPVVEGHDKRKLPVTKLWCEFLEFKRPKVRASQFAKLVAVQNWVNKYLDVDAIGLSDEQAESFRAQLINSELSLDTVKTYIGLIRGAWTWGMKRKGLTDNPWIDIKTKVPAVQPRPSSTHEEVKAIVWALQNDRHYRHYADLVQFRFLTGCRPGEASALRWRHITADCANVWIGESYGIEGFGPVKTGEARTIELGDKVRLLLEGRRPTADLDLDSLVFPGPKGAPIDANNFRKRAWAAALKGAGILDGRDPYTTRHTFITHAIEGGMKPKMVAEMAGTSVQVIYRHYLGNGQGRSAKTPDLF